jgi:dihydroorotate dehydrogenase
MLYENLIKPILFRLGDPEHAHELSMKALAILGNFPPAKTICEKAATLNNPALQRELFGLRFRNPVGLAAGFDKNAVAIPGFEALGFGFIEIGTVTRHPQAGNSKPRVFRFPQDEALINRFGFNNDGADVVAARLARVKRNPLVPLGVSLGKSKITPLEDAVGDYVYSLKALHAYGDYFAVNVSSPNTPGLRQLQDKTMLDELLAALLAELHALAAAGGLAKRKPILVKIAPDLEWDALAELLATCASRNVDGVIATNTTLGRAGLTSPTTETGGLSGKPLTGRALDVVKFIRKESPALPIIGVGGIMTANDAIAMLDAGAQLIQLYTGLIYHGPFLPKQINQRVAANRR